MGFAGIITLIKEFVAMLNEQRIFTNKPAWAGLTEVRRDDKWVWFRKGAATTIQTALSNVLAYEKRSK